MKQKRKKSTLLDTIEEKFTIQGRTGRKGKGKGKEVRWRRNMERTCSTGFWERGCKTNIRSTG